MHVVRRTTEVIELAEHWHYAPKMWWMVQGNRKVNPGSTEEQAAIKFGERAAEKQIGLRLGAYGDYVKLLTKTGVVVVCHTSHAGERETKIPPEIEVVDCFKLARRIGGDADEAWHIRLSRMTSGIQAAIYFPGGPGTRLHMSPIGFNLANLSRNKPLVVPKIALVGWRSKQIEALIDFWELGAYYRSYGDHIRWKHERNTWIASFNLSDIDQMVAWLVG